MKAKDITRGFFSAPPSTNEPVEHPTWLANIRQMFVPEDISHMRPQGIDLSSYDNVKALATSIYGQVATGNMPHGRTWSEAWNQTFLNWIKDGCPRGVPQPAEMLTASLKKDAKSATRVRKDINTLTEDEWAKVVKAFEGIMALDTSDPNSYFVQAGYHWYPLPYTYCMHHAPGYNPWHRAQMFAFEDALRSIEGCEDVTLPYWDKGIGRFTLDRPSVFLSLICQPPTRRSAVTFSHPYRPYA
jgi:hypothetical protein